MVGALPILHVPPPAASASRQEWDVTTFVSLGNARDEKGVLEILDAIAILKERGEIGGMRFILQCNDATPDLATAIQAFRVQAVPECELIDQALPSDQYYQLLYSADVVLLPYRRSIYVTRTSGVFMETVAAGKPVIATFDTWMSDQIADFAAEYEVRDGSATHLADAMRHVREQIDNLSPMARARR